MKPGPHNPPRRLRTPAVIGCLLACAPFMVQCARSVAVRLPWRSDYASALVPPAPTFWNSEGYGCDDRSLRTMAEPDPSLADASSVGALLHTEGFAFVTHAVWGTAQQRRFVIADQARGVRVIDASDPTRPRVIGPLPIAGHALHVQVVNDHALVVVQRGPTDYDVLWLGLSLEHGPTLIHQTSAWGGFRAAYVTDAKTGHPARAFLVVDRGETETVCSPRKDTVVRVLDLDDAGPMLRAELELGVGRMRVMRSGDFLFVAHNERLGFGGRPPEATLRALDLTLDPSALALTDPLPIGDGVKGVQTEGRRVRLVWDRGEGARGHAKTTVHVSTLRVGPGSALTVTRDCSRITETVLGPPHDNGWPIPQYVSQTLFLSQHTVTPLLKDTFVFQDASCRSEVVERVDLVVTPARNGTRFLGFKGDARSLRVRMYDPAHPASPVAEHTLGPLRTGGLPRFSATHARVFDFADAAAETLVAIPFEERDGREGRDGSRLLRVTDDAIADGPTLDSMLWQMPNATMVVGVTNLAMDFSRITDASETERLGRAVLWQHFRQAIFVNGGIARLGWSGTLNERDPHARTSLSSLELLPDGRDVQTGEAITRFPLSAGARLDNVGGALIATTQSGHGAPCSIDVFDVRSLSTAQKTATFEGVCDEHHGLDDITRLKLPHALVFVSAEHYPATGTRRLALFAIDVRDPAHPVLRGPFRTPAGEWALRAFAQDARVVYAYRVPVADSDPAHPEVRYYVRPVDFGDPATPVIGAPISVAGEAWAVDGDAIYTVDVVPGEQVEQVVRKSQWQPDVARIVASQRIVSDPVTSLHVIGQRHLLVTWLITANVPPYAETHFLALSADTLERRSETVWDRRVTYVAATADHVLYKKKTSTGVVAALSLRAEDRPAITRIAFQRDEEWEATSVDVRNNDVLLLRNGVLHRRTVGGSHDSNGVQVMR